MELGVHASRARDSKTPLVGFVTPNAAERIACHPESLMTN